MGTVTIEYDGRVLATVDEQVKSLELSFEEGIMDISRIKGLDHLVNLKELGLSGNGIQRIEGLENLVNLKELNLGRNQIQKIEGLENLVKLECLYLESNQIQQIQGLDKLVNLNILRLGSNQIQKIEGLDRLVNLKELNLGRNQIQKIEGLDHLVNLKELHLGRNQIQRIEGLENLVILEELDLDFNQIEKIEGLDRLVKLLLLKLDSNQIQRIEGLDRLVNLKELDLGSNQIQQVEGLESLVNLGDVHLVGNVGLNRHPKPTERIEEKKKVCSDCGREFTGNGNMCDACRAKKTPIWIDSLAFISICAVLGILAGTLGSTIIDGIVWAIFGLIGGITSDVGMRIPGLPLRRDYHAKLLPLIMVTVTTTLLGGDARLGFLLGLILTSISIPHGVYAVLEIVFLLASTGIGMLIGGLITSWGTGVSIGGITGLVIMFFFWVVVMVALFYNDTIGPEWVQTLGKDLPGFYFAAFGPIAVIIAGFITGWIIIATVASFLIIIGVLWISFIPLLITVKKKK